MSRRPAAPLLLGAALAVSLAASVAGCGGANTHTLDAKSAAQAISHNLADSTGLPTPKVTCPSGVEVKLGNKFDCTTVLEGQPLTIHGDLTDSKGGFTVKPAAAILIVAKAVSAIVANMKATAGTAAVDCGTRTVLVKAPGEIFLCTAAAGGVVRTVTVKVTDLQGHVNFEVAPPGSTLPTTSVPATGSTGTSTPTTLIGGG